VVDLQPLGIGGLGDPDRHVAHDVDLHRGPIRRRGSRRVELHAKLEAAHPHHAARLQGNLDARLDQFTIEERAVGRAEIPQINAAVLLEEFAVFAAHPVLLDAKLRLLAAADHDREPHRKGLRLRCWLGNDEPHVHRESPPPEGLTASECNRLARPENDPLQIAQKTRLTQRVILRPLPWPL